MSTLLDTGILYAYYDRSDRWHQRARALVQGAERGLILPAPVIPEVDHLLGARLGAKSRLAFYAGIVEGHYLVADVPKNAYQRIVHLNRRFADLDLGFVDADGTVRSGTTVAGTRTITHVPRRSGIPFGRAADRRYINGKHALQRDPIRDREQATGDRDLLKASARDVSPRHRSRTGRQRAGDLLPVRWYFKPG